MSTRYREVYPTDEIAHLWAHKTQASARNPQGNFYFRGDVIYSYRDSYPLAKHVTGKNGQAGVLINRDGYSNTTAGHLSQVRRAVSHVAAQWEVDHPTDGTPQQLESWAQRIKDKSVTVLQPRIRKATTARRYEELQELVAQANSFATFFGIKPTFSVPEFGELKATLEAEAQKAEAKRKRDTAKDAKRKAEQEREYRAKTAGQLEEWLAGVPDVCPPRLPEAYLRIAQDEDGPNIQVQTSLGARVPIAHAIRAARLIKGLIEHHQAKANAGDLRPEDWGKANLYERNGHSIHIGNYVLDKVTADGTVWAGCHKIERAEFERFSKVLEEWQAKHGGEVGRIAEDAASGGEMVLAETGGNIEIVWREV